MIRKSLLHPRYIRRAGLLLLAGGLGAGLIGCDKDTGRTPRADSDVNMSRSTANGSQQAPGSEVGAASTSSGSYSGTSPNTSAPPATASPPSASNESTPSTTQAAAGSASGQGGDTTTSAAASSDLTAGEKNNAMPQPKQNNDHSTPPTVRGQIGKDGQTYPSGSGTSESGTIAPRG